MKKIDSILVFLFFTVFIIGLCDNFIDKNKSNNGNIQLKTCEAQNEIITGNKLTLIMDVNKIEKENDIQMVLNRFKEFNKIKDKKEWFIAYKNIIGEYSYIIDSPETIYDCFTDEELDLLFRTVQAEIGDEYSFEQKCNVASVIFNRVYHEKFPNNLKEILIPSQFSVIKSERYKEVEVSETTILACEYAFLIGDTTNGCLFFDSNNVLNYCFLFNDGAHNFYILWEDYYAQEEN